ncbi:uncharacterized protein LOC116406722 [Xenopus tropicalis]|uniref:Uncharacterized protein LOC116406722 n=1 Tax=Xenopus tropicalis TaxID=8364 RepID=A0A8J1INX9_XENTR|nr:uncharacterized protein LOC116406722 [Xenopus tropicalis]
MAELNHEVRQLEGRTDHLENKMAELVSSHNELIDANSTLESEVDKLTNKLADIEDRNRRNNLRIRGVPEQIKMEDLNHYLTEMLQTLLPQEKLEHLLVDRAHRLPRNKNAPPGAPREVILRLHFYHIKELTLNAFRNKQELPDKYTTLQCYPDLSAHTMKKRKDFAQVTVILREADIPYRWLFPVKLRVVYKDTPYIMDTPQQGNHLLKQWSLLPPQETPQKQPPKKQRLQQEWQTTKNSHKRAPSISTILEQVDQENNENT